MKVELPAYPEYKRVKNDWLNKLPESWGLLPIKRVSRVKTGVAKGRKFGDQETVWLPYLRVANVQDGYLDLRDVSEIEVLEDEVPRFSLQKGDVLMNEGGDADKLGRGHVWNGELDPCLHQNHVFAIRCKSVLPYWVSAVTSSQYARAFFETRAKQSTNLASISKANLSELPIVFPPIGEQRTILAFLDRETAKIDRLMEVRRKQVERLQEQRTAVIHHAVTKGLDPHAKMKPSGVEWLGDVPIGWKVYRLRHLLRPGKDGMRIGPFGSSLKAEFIRDEGHKVYGQENVIGRSFDLGRRYIDDDKYSELREYALRAGDVLITMMGSIGRCIVVPDAIAHGIMDSHLIRVGVDSRKVDSFYLALLIEAAPYVAACIQHESKGSIMDGLNSAIIKRLVILLPGLDDQRQVIAHVQRETQKFDTLITKYRRELELLAEYRASLISHAVTGKIDVRGIVSAVEATEAA